MRQYTPGFFMINNCGCYAANLLDVIVVALITGCVRESQLNVVPQGENPGIISSAIANAEKLPSTPGQENVSLLQQHSSSVKSSPTATQFTFTCDSPVPKPQWPGTDPLGSHGSLPGYGNKFRQASMATQTLDAASSIAAPPASTAGTPARGPPRRAGRAVGACPGAAATSRCRSACP